jgi:hypothetical protein
MRLSINQLLAPFAVGHEVDRAAKAHSFVFCEHVTVANSWQIFLPSPAEKLGV